MLYLVFVPDSLVAGWVSAEDYRRANVVGSALPLAAVAVVVIVIVIEPAQDSIGAPVASVVMGVVVVDSVVAEVVQQVVAAVVAAALSL